MPKTGDYNPVLVTGASGFLGQCIVRRLLEQGLYPHALVRPGFKRWRFQGIKDFVACHETDLADAGTVRVVLEETKPRVVIHCAAYGCYEWQTDVQRIIRTNMIGTFNLLSACLAVNVRLFINIGSSSEYGFRSEPMLECDRLEPNSVYAVAKAGQTHLATLLARSNDIGLVTFRLFSVFGPWEEPVRLIPTLIRHVRRGLPMQMVSPETARDLIYTDDVMAGILNFTALESYRGDIFNLGSSVQSTMREIVETAQEVLDRRIEVHWGAMPERRWDSVSWRADISKSQRCLNWTPRISLREGIRRMANWMDTVGDDYGMR